MSTVSALARRAFPAALLAAGMTLASACFAALNAYSIARLDSDVAGAAAHTDPNLVNPWGVAFNPNGFVWVADNHTGKSTLYDGNGVVQGLVVTIPAAAGAGTGSPTGIVFSGSSDFMIPTGPPPAPMAASRFIFASEDGLISAWAPGMTVAARAVTRAGANYKGLALAGNGTANLLYAADFAGRKIDVYTGTFTPTTVPGGFADPRLPRDYTPFNITNIQGNLYVAYAKFDEASDEEKTGPGLGIVNVFDADGFLLKRLASFGVLNAPWGMALAPAGFGAFGNMLLVGNFGDGKINAFDPSTGAHVGTLRTQAQQDMVIEGLWGIAFGPGIQSQPTDTLFFAAGINDEEHGLYGRIDAIGGDNPR
jgi:uncharacterized protein (TIGR03118 family)